jgi:hypothetical protein
MAKFLFVSSSQGLDMRTLSEIFPRNGIFNFAAVVEEENQEILICVSNHFSNESLKLRNVLKTEIMSTLYANKLLNMHRKLIKIVANERMPNVEFDGQKVISIHNYLFDHISELINASFDIQYVQASNPFMLWDKISSSFNVREIDGTLSTIPPVLPFAIPKIFSYTEDGFCALVPLMATSTVSLGPLFEVFETSGIILLVLATLCYMILWIIYKMRGEAQGSSWNVVFGFFATLIGQGFRFRTTSFVMNLLLINFIIQAFVMNNFFQGRK